MLCHHFMWVYFYVDLIYDIKAGGLVSLLRLPRSKVRFRSGDFFKFSAKEEGNFDVILDYTFLW